MPIKRGPKGEFLPGGSPGRPKGSRNQLTADFIRALATDFAEYGEGVIRVCRVETPQIYLKIIASLMPKELLLPDSVFEEMDDSELVEALATIRRLKSEAASFAAEPLSEIGKTKVTH